MRARRNDGSVRSMTNPNAPWVSLATSDLSAAIDPLGAQLSVLRDRDGRDLLWNGDPAVWAGRAPLLFPIVGTLAGGTYRLGSASYRLSRHGFARGSRFEVLESSTAGATFRLSSDAASLQIYPFDFQLDIGFALRAATLDVTATVRNLGAEPLPASIGFHPAFRWPLPYGRPRPAHGIEFAEDEPAPVRRLDAAGLLAPEQHVTPIVARRLALSDDLFRNDALIMDGVRSRSVSYGAADGPRLRVDFPDAPLLAIWSKPGANFVCIEPWHGVADPAGFAGDFRSKPGVFSVGPGAAMATTMSITLLPG